MTEKMICVRPDYVKNFHCDGTACSSMCCQLGWKIIIDNSSYKKYKTLNNSSIRKSICENIRKIKGKKEYEVVLEPNGRCPFLDDNLLCFIQKKFGPEYLSDTCASYPRQNHLLGNYIEQSLSMSCPVAMRLALANDKKFQLEYVSVDLQSIRNLIDMRNEVIKVRYILDLQIITIPLLQFKHFTIEQRLNIVRQVIDLVESYIEREEDIPTDYVEKAIRNTDFTDICPIDDPRSLFLLFNQLVDDGVVYITESSHNYVADVIDAFDLSDGDIPVSILLDKYHNNEKYYKKYVEEPYSQMLENFIVNTWFTGCFPFALKGKISYNFHLYSLQMQLMKLYLMSIAKKKRDNLNKEDIESLLKRIAIRLEHSEKYLESAWKFTCKCMRANNTIV